MLEVRNLTGSPAKAVERLSRVIQTDMNPAPLAAVLPEAASSQSRACLEHAGCGTSPLPLSTM